MNNVHKQKRVVSRADRSRGWSIYTNLKASDADESVLDINDVVNVDLESDNVQPFNTRWDETIIAMEKTTWNSGKSVESSVWTVGALKPLLSYIQEICCSKDWKWRYIRLKKSCISNRNSWAALFFVNDNLKSASLALQQPRSSFFGKGFSKRTRFSEWNNTPTWFVFKEGECENGNMCDYGIHQSVLLIKKVAHLTLGVCSSILNRANRRSQIIPW